MIDKWVKHLIQISFLNVPLLPFVPFECRDRHFQNVRLNNNLSLWKPSAPHFLRFTMVVSVPHPRSTPTFHPMVKIWWFPNVQLDSQSLLRTVKQLWGWSLVGMRNTVEGLPIFPLSEKAIVIITILTKSHCLGGIPSYLFCTKYTPSISARPIRLNQSSVSWSQPR